MRTFQPYKQPYNILVCVETTLILMRVKIRVGLTKPFLFPIQKIHGTRKAKIRKNKIIKTEYNMQKSRCMTNLLDRNKHGRKSTPNSDSPAINCAQCTTHNPSRHNSPPGKFIVAQFTAHKLLQPHSSRIIHNAKIKTPLDEFLLLLH
jgi:hypothetical protein